MSKGFSSNKRFYEWILYSARCKQNMEVRWKSSLNCSGCRESSPQRMRPGPRLWQLPYSLTFIWKYVFLDKRKIDFSACEVGNLCIFVLFLLLRTTEIRKKCNNRIVKLFRKKRLGGGVCLSLVTRSLKRTHLASLSGSCSQFEILLMLIHLMPDSLSTFVLVCWLIDNFMFGE